jgi:hypothetical protein
VILSLVDKESHTETNIRMMLFRDRNTPWTVLQGRLQDEAKGKCRIALKDTSRRENESRSGCLVDHGDRGHALGMRLFRIGVMRAGCTVYG